MIDYIILCACSPFAVIMQLHPGWVGFLQTQGKREAGGGGAARRGPKKRQF